MNKKLEPGGKKKTVLITGGAGFIGSHLCGRLINEGHKVICVDSFFSGKKENISHLLGQENFRLIRHNIIYPLKEEFDSLDEIYNLACPASPLQYQFDPILTLKTSVDGTENMLKLARKYRAKMLQASTSEVYGDPLENPQRETYFGNVDPLGERACYDEGKRAAECLCKDYHRQFGVDARIVRLFNIYGPRMMFNDGRVISNFILQALLGENITVHGDGSQSRSFMYIDDLIEALLKVMALPKERFGLGPLNLGNPDERTIKSLAEDVKKLSASSSRISYVDYENLSGRLGDPQRRQPDISKAERLLDWRPRVDFFSGMTKTIQDFKKRINNKTKVIVFATAYLPIDGPAEVAIKEITDRLIAYDFTIITAKLDKNFSRQEKIGRVNVYRLGWGNTADKYLLPLWGPIKAWQLNQRNNFQVAWGIMAFGALSAIIFSFLARLASLASLYESKLDGLKPVYKTIFKRANSLQVMSELTEEQRGWVDDGTRLEIIPVDKGWDYVAQNTKKELQQLEILTSRL